VAAAVLAELDRLVKRRLGTEQVGVLKEAMRELMDLDAPRFAADRGQVLNSF
jgi:hypothetical protein